MLRVLSGRGGFRGRPGRLRRRDGSALIVVIWVVGLLSILLASFAFDAHVEARIVSFYRKRAQAEYLARSGIEVAKMLMVKSREVSENDEDPDDAWLGPAKELKKGQISGLKADLGEGSVTLTIVPEPGRRNINSLGESDERIEQNIERILEVGGIPEELWPVLIESFLDWIDGNTNPRVDGAETEDYYETLSPPYRAKNGPLDTVGELLLIRGWTREVLYGGRVPLTEGDDEGVPVSGVADLLTTYGKGKVNINAASERVLRTLPGVDAMVSGAIREERGDFINVDAGEETDPFESVADLSARLPDLDAGLSDYIEFDSSVYRISSIGNYQDVEREVWLIAEYNSGDEALDIKRWREQE